MSHANVAGLIAHLSTLPPDSPITCQVVGSEHPGAWMMFYDFVLMDDKTVQLRVHHPQLKQVNPEVKIVD